ncbi:hypothetical protein VNO78_20903 [Psophocarpus tetragonolobus]|uniref:Uncharacterized protein n=1 Tax=Psophocarpus tetragonolobus TaxID=3891 RepID=A0AAN9SA82_PSOTE
MKILTYQLMAIITLSLRLHLLSRPLVSGSAPTMKMCFTVFSRNKQHSELKMLRSFVGKIVKGVSHFVHRKPYFSEATSAAPVDVREGYFAVLAIKGGEPKRFIVGLHYLNDPAFLRLLDQAQEEFGFKQKGALEIPCQPLELQNILDGRRA